MPESVPPETAVDLNPTIHTSDHLVAVRPPDGPDDPYSAEASMFPDLALPALMGVLLGASAHRTGLCTVKAVAEIMTTGNAHVLWSFFKASFWTLGLLSIALLFGAAPDLSVRSLSAGSLAGGMIFGIGAALNGACSLSTFTRLAEGHSVMLVTLIGWGLGLVAMHLFVSPAFSPSSTSQLSGWLVFAGFAWILWEGVRLFVFFARRRGALFADGHWPLSLGVLVIAIANAGLLLMDRPWSITSTAICASGAATVAPCAHPVTLWSVTAVAFTSMVVSARLRGSFRIRPIRLRSGLRRLAAGTMMGAGAALIPGGNDGLILFGIPALSPHALPAWIGILAGVWMALVVMQRLGARIPTIRCESDICRAAL